jgi:phosphatidate cytidylyltransferase
MGSFLLRRRSSSLQKKRSQDSVPTEDGVASFGPQIPLKAGRNLTQAVVTAAALLAIAVACYAGGPTYFFWLVAVVVALAYFELLDALRQSGRRPALVLGIGSVVALMSAAYFRPDRPEFLLVVVALVLVGSFISALRPSRGPSPASDIAWSILALVWIGGGGAAAASMLTLDSGLNLLIAHVLVIALDDTGAYFVGVRWGRTRMAPSISPGKSWEGFAGGLVAALIGGAAAGSILGELGITHGLALGAINGLLAPVGDLAESMAKRELGIKDSGRLLPGHGGFLDRLDAIIFCTPAVLLYLRVTVG